MVEQKEKIVGIVTHPLAANYGGILQNFALQQVLRKMGYFPITLDVYNSYPYWRYLISLSITCLSRFFGKKRVWPIKPYLGRSIPENSANFITKYIATTQSSEKLNSDLLKKHRISSLVVGSDQVWRPEYVDNISDMFLGFAQTYKCRKIAYAASFGVDEWTFNQEQTKQCMELISEFDAVSVREESGINLCAEKLNHFEAKHVLDPTLLLEQSDYASVCSNVPSRSHPYILTYFLDSSTAKQNVAEEYSGNAALPLTQLSNSLFTGPSIEEWLAKFRDASVVITDSFHGMVFSIIFEKDFYIMVNSQRGTTRFTSLLSKLDLLDRIVTSDCISSEKSPINWRLVKEKFSGLKSYSLSFLEESLCK